jgi:hypothetical protein
MQGCWCDGVYTAKEKKILRKDSKEKMRIFQNKQIENICC